MKKKIYAFLVFSLLALMVAPLVNLSSGNISGRPKDTEWWDTSVLYNMDFALPLLGGIYYSLGISLSPEKVVIGKDGWLYLGDEYANSISSKRIGLTSESDVLLDKLADSANAWEAWFTKNGAQEYRVMICPDKESIYPEYLPTWARHSPLSLTNAMMKKIGTEFYINPTKSLLKEKENYKNRLYFKTDTHWNNLGAWVAFSELSKDLARTQPELIWPNPDIANHFKVIDRKGGDLAKFQRIQNYLTDNDVSIDTFSTNPIPVEQYDFETGKLLTHGNNSSIEPPRTPLLVKSRKALNHKKVLWLRDSFGVAMSPFMAATFTETLQIHHALATPELLAKLVEKFKPDYVIITVVERDSRDGHFLLLPPMSITNSRNGLYSVAQGSTIAANDLSEVNKNGTYQVSGIDPYIISKLSKSINPKEANQVVFELSCANNLDKIPVQLFWRSENAGFSENNSIYFSANQGITSLDISVNPAWAKSAEIAEMRIDLVSPNECQRVTMKNFEVGLIHKQTE